MLVTVFNRAKFVQETLESILASTYSDFEVIVSDDNSTDSSLDIANRAAQADQRVIVLRNEKNLGDYPNRMSAAKHARGRYLKYLDSDDIIYPHSLAIMVESIERYPEAALALAHSMPEDKSPYPLRLTPQEAYRKHFLGRGCLSCGPSGAIMRREAFEAVGGFRPEWGVLTDIDLWYRMAARWPTVLLPPGLVWWRRHEGQEFTKSDAESAYLKHGYELDIAALTIVTCPLSGQDQEAAVTRRRQHMARRIFSIAGRQRDLKLAWKIFRASRLSLPELIKGLGGYT